MIVAIDGPAGAGKSSVAQAVAERLSLQYVNTGAIYRTLAYMAKEEGVPWEEPARLAALAARLTIRFVMRDGVNTVHVSLDGGEPREVTGVIRAPEISRATSRISAFPEVRAALLELQRQLGRASDSLLEGRDIGTVVFPDADVKLYLTASSRERAGRRRAQQLEAASDPSTVPSLESIAQEIEERDERDANRAVAPLRAAADAVSIDTTGVEFDEVVEQVLSAIRSA
ncbi:MAG: cytidylate kinase [Myxococcales bacterium]|nr:cytidylate kinase [Myxococcales bacterium]